MINSLAHSLSFTRSLNRKYDKNMAKLDEKGEGVTRFYKSARLLTTTTTTTTTKYID